RGWDRGREGQPDAKAEVNIGGGEDEGDQPAEQDCPDGQLGRGFGCTCRQGLSPVHKEAGGQDVLTEAKTQSAPPLGRREGRPPAALFAMEEGGKGRLVTAPWRARCRRRPAGSCRGGRGRGPSCGPPPAPRRPRRRPVRAWWSAAG